MGRWMAVAVIGLAGCGDCVLAGCQEHELAVEFVNANGIAVTPTEVQVSIDDGDWETVTCGSTCILRLDPRVPCTVKASTEDDTEKAKCTDEEVVASIVVTKADECCEKWAAASMVITF